MIRPQKQHQKISTNTSNQPLLKSLYKIDTSGTQRSLDNKSVGNVNANKLDASFKKKLYHGSAPKV